jgi:hypothetical protein
VKSLILIAAILIAYPAFGQEIKHAPTVAQCQADQRLWAAKLEQPHGQVVTAVPYSTLMEWLREMGDCEDIDPAQHDLYMNTSGEAITAMASRLREFVYRHKMWEQFLKEDAAGTR